jgi:hypothetical protein
MKNWMSILLALLAPATATGSPNPQQITAAPVPLPSCADTVRDQATGGCVSVSSTPTIGMLFPFSSNFYLDSNETLRLRDIIADNFIFAKTLVGDDLQANDDLKVFGRLSIGAVSPQADLHIKSQTDATLLVEADWDNAGEFDHPEVLFSQDGGVVQAFVGFQDGENDISIRNLFSGGGLRFDLHTSSTRDWEFRRRATAGLDVEARLTQSGNLQLDGSVSSPAADLAEFYPVLGIVEPGDVVAFSGQGLALERARAGAAGRLAGVISSRPAFAMGLSYTVEDELGVEPDSVLLGEPFPASAPELRADPAVVHEIEVNRRAPLALSGRVPCKVSSENGPILAGDFLTLASLPGHAMKATGSGPIVGTALEPWSAGTGKILVFANLGWFSPSEDLEHRVATLEAEVQRLLAR